MTDEQNVYWTDSSIGEVKQTPLGGGSVLVLADDDTDLSSGNPWNVVTNYTTVFFTADGVGIQSVPIGGGTVTTIVSNDAIVGPIAVDPAYVYYGPCAVGSSAGEICRVPTGGGTSEIVWVGTSGYPGPIAVDSFAIYWFDGSGIWKLAK